MNADTLREAIARDIFETLMKVDWPIGASMGELADYREAAERLVKKYVFVPWGTEEDPLRDAIAGEIFEALMNGFEWPQDTDGDDLAAYGEVADYLLKEYIVTERPKGIRVNPHSVPQSLTPHVLKKNNNKE